ncbi:MAG TPA: amidase [Thermomicrobiales bacterium]|nr:amidase [Thermomicrobiales bacterium]
MLDAEIRNASVAELRAALDAGELTSRALVESCLARIEALDRQGPTLGAVIEINPDALTIADALDAELKTTGARGPLHGIPILLKDNVATIDPMETTAGSLALVGARPVKDAFLAARLREAGVVILGKANLSEWSNFRSTRAVSGWSGRGGQAVNPHQLDRSSSGSSSGPGVAVAAGYVPFAVGTETNGSIVSPAGSNGIVGIKPTIGLVSRQGVVPISHNQDTAGPMARSVADAAVLLQVLAAPDPDDLASHEGERPKDVPSYPARPARISAGEADYVAALDADGLRGARIGVLRRQEGPGWVPGDPILLDIIATLKDAGAEVIDPVLIPEGAEQKWGVSNIDNMLWEFKATIADYLATFAPDFPIKDLAGLIAFNNEHAEEEMPWFGQDLFERSEAMTGLDDPAYIELEMRLQRNSRELGLDAMLAEHNLDAIVALTNGPAWKIDPLLGDRPSAGSSGLAALAGYPLVTLPAATYGGMPIGLTFMAGAYSEETLIRLAYSFEQRTHARRDPQFLPGAVYPAEK